jgi:formylglycine-generating enzyme required for sulfatase activity
MAFASAFKETIERHGRRPGDIAKNFENDPGFLGDFITIALEDKPSWAELLLFIDQFEELFTLVASQYQANFIDLLDQAAKNTRVRTVVTLRDDFFHRCNQRPVLNTLLKNGQYTLLVPNLEQLREMITRPAKERAGLDFENGLVERILNDTGTEQGALALMAYALHELWETTKRHGRIMTHAAYLSFNGVHGAIGQRAEETFTGFKDRKMNLEDLFTRVFRELVEVDEHGVTSRRRAKISSVTDKPEAEVLVNALIEDRILVTGRGEGNEPTVEVAHEAIFTSWDRLSRWIEIRRDDLRLLRQVRLAADEWDHEGRAGFLLWPHKRLIPVNQMLVRLKPALSELELKFILHESESLIEETERSTTTHQQRAKIGDRLAEIEDPRRGVGLRRDGLPDIAWCKVPGGEITGIFAVEPFNISKYPVTFKQYRSFIDAKDGYQDKCWWKGLAQRRDKPGKQNRKLDNHPAENVNWYDAMAFCRWMTKQTGYEIRLPTEWEWQQAATGGDPNNCYPWGTDWDPNRVNTAESALSRTTAVGMYPQGASLVGAFDMSGNVWEWCYNPQRIEETGKACRSVPVRGGSARRQRIHALCTAQYYRDPRGRSDFTGFRLLSYSPIA